jgi:hypothetical protein
MAILNKNRAESTEKIVYDNKSVGNRTITQGFTGANSTLQL